MYCEPVYDNVYVGACRSHKRALNSLKTELQAVVCLPPDMMKKNSHPQEEQRILLTVELSSSLTTPVLPCLFSY